MIDEEIYKQIIKEYLSKECKLKKLRSKMDFKTFSKNKISITTLLTVYLTTTFLYITFNKYNSNGFNNILRFIFIPILGVCVFIFIYHLILFISRRKHSKSCLRDKIIFCTVCVIFIPIIYSYILFVFKIK